MRRAPSIPPAGLLLVLCLAACDGSGRACEQARGHLDRGEFERAEACLVDARGAEAQSLRASIDRQRANRSRITARIAELRAELGASSADAVDEELSGELLLTRDPAARQMLEQARSEFADLFAARDRPGFGLAVLGSEGAQQAGVVELTERQRLLAELRQDAGLALEDRAWSQAWRLLDRLTRFRELDAAELAALRDELLEGAAHEAEQLLAASAALEAEGDPAGALVLLKLERERFPARPEFAFFHEPLAALASRAASALPEEQPEDQPGSHLTTAERTRLVDSFLRFDHAARVAAWPTLRGLADQRVPTAALAGCAEQAQAVLREGAFLDQLAQLADLRATLDRQRAEALARIFDERTYFYPHDPPEPPHTRPEYVRAQRLVDQLVEPLRATWAQEFTVALSPELADASADLRWAREQARRSGVEDVLPTPLPAYTGALPEDLESLSIREFARSWEEARELELGRRVRALNEAAWDEPYAAAPGLGLAGIPDAEERELMRMINDYRALFGRPVLAWNARLQAASQGHSDYMREHASLTHIEEEPTRRRVADRSALAGYSGVTGENCAHHSLGPRAVFTLWVHSSGHHRNLLLEAYREVGTACAEEWWTQVLGCGTNYREALRR